MPPLKTLATILIKLAVAGEVLDKIREDNTKNTLAGKPHVRDFPYKDDYAGVHRQRQIDVALQLFEVMGISREDKEKRMEWMMRGFRQFDAPVSLVLTYDKSLEPAGITQFGQGIMQSDVVHKHAQIPDNEAIIICIVMGYPDDDFEANNLRSVRADNKDFVSYHGF
jgi:hypothetical protein